MATYTYQQNRALTHSTLGGIVKYSRTGEDQRSFLYYWDGFRVYLPQEEIDEIMAEIYLIEKYNKLLGTIKEDSYLYSTKNTRSRTKKERI